MQKPLSAGKQTLLSAVLAVGTAFLSSVKIAVVDTDAAASLLRSESGAPLALFLAKLRLAGNGFAPVSAALAVLLFFIYRKTLRRFGLRFRGSALAIALLFGFFDTLGRSMQALDSLGFLLANAFQLLLGLGRMLACAVLFYTAELWLYEALDAKARDVPGPAPALRYPAFLKKHLTLLSALLLLACWLPYLIAFFPGCVNWDTYVQLNNAFGLVAQNNDHPIFLSYLMGGCVALGRKLFQSDNIGVYFFFLLQAAVSAFSLSSLVTLLRDLGMRRGFRIACLLFFAGTPIFGAYAVMGHKDTLFSACFVCFLVWNVRVGLLGFSGKRAVLSGALSALALCLTRNGGLPLVLLLLLFHFVRFLIKRRERPAAKPERAACLALALAAGTAALLTGALLPSLGVRPAAKKELLSVPLQQTSRYLRDHKDAVTEAEQAAIDAILSRDEWQGEYDPRLADPAKNRYLVTGAANENELLAAYGKAWAGMLKKHPRTYLEALLANTASYYTLSHKAFENADMANHGMVFRLSIESGCAPDLGYFSFSAPEALSGMRDTMENFANLFGSLPGLNLAYACAFYTWLLLALIGYLLHKRAWAALAFGALPPFFVLLGCFASPVDNCFRYFLPIAASLPLVPALCAARIRH